MDLEAVNVGAGKMIEALWNAGVTCDGDELMMAAVDTGLTALVAELYYQGVRIDDDMNCYTKPSEMFRPLCGMPWAAERCMLAATAGHLETVAYQLAMGCRDTCASGSMMDAAFRGGKEGVESPLVLLALLPPYPLIRLPTYPLTYLPAYLLDYLPTYPLIRLPTHLSAYLPIRFYTTKVLESMI